MSPFLDPNDDDGLHAVIVALILIILTLAIVFAGVSHHVGKAAAKAALGKLKQAPIKQQLYRHRKRGRAVVRCICQSVELTPYFEQPNNHPIAEGLDR